ncbi:hypothetical protein, partial [Rugosimonospora africana]|uniref:hypothetical protein n=1 Tax=Rugosimonospora africana TaxID=556532 RepID=UPI0019414088
MVNNPRVTPTGNRNVRCLARATVSDPGSNTRAPNNGSGVFRTPAHHDTCPTHRGSAAATANRDDHRRNDTPTPAKPTPV